MHRLKHTLLIVLVVLLAACGGTPATPPVGGGNTPTAVPQTGGGNTPAPAQQPVTLRWSVWGSPEELASHQAVADAYMKANPSVKTVIEHTPWDGYHTKLKTIVASGDLSALPDVMFLGQDFNQYASQGVLENLTLWIKRSGSILRLAPQQSCGPPAQPRTQRNPSQSVPIRADPCSITRYAYEEDLL
ncbi:MAG: extracellular solute-binding protein [Roseiflexaceae bacterium]|nr:extracellular solute-binding protein [Roseiflexus sp.]MDW8144700.1 extracellular solute-binding protein [Roseiflexaceae bacterium]MDW8233255.1 extracellular solute-binding protein [Roseiflexaceae bacterium]